MHVAVVGSGVSGLGAAWALSSRGHAVTVLEASSTFGGHALSCAVDVPHRGTTVAVNPAYDIFNPTTYPRLTALLRDLDAPTVDRPFTYTYRGGDQPVLRMPTLLNPRNAAQLRHRHYRRFVRVASRLGRHLDRWMRTPDHAVSWGQLLREAGVPPDLVAGFFLPAFARPWGVKPSDMAHMPAALVGGWAARHRTLTPRPLRWRTHAGGAGAYITRWVRALRAAGVRLHADCPVRSVRPTAAGVQLRHSGRVHHVDHVVLATNARQALALLETPTSAQAQALGAFRYQTNHVIVHSDARLAPTRRRDWSTFNVQFDPRLDETWNSIWFGQEAGAPVFATNHRTLPFRPRAVHAEFSFHQPVFDADTPAARQRLASAQGTDGIWFAGVYAHGTGHHEDGLVMAETVARGIDESRTARLRQAG